MDEILDRVWLLLSAGANAEKERSPFTMMQLATLGLDGGPRVRTIVVRRANRGTSSLSFHTDVRSEKVAELQTNSRVSLVGCDLNAGIQIRLEGVATIVCDQGERAAVWDASRPRTLILYRAPLSPGTPIESPTDARASLERGDVKRTGFENFCLVDIAVTKIDYLDLSPQGHLRAQFRPDRGMWHGTWVAP